jgi:hypothetical protein
VLRALLLERGEDVNVQNKQQRTPLHLASYFGKLEIARLLLDRGAKLDAADEFGQTPLHDVSRGEYISEEAGVSVARLLLERGEDVNVKNKQQRDTITSRILQREARDCTAAPRSWCKTGRCGRVWPNPAALCIARQI